MELSLALRQIRRFGGSFSESSFTVDVLSRYLSTALSFVSLLLLVQIMTIKEFAIFQVSYSVAAIALWIGDFGLGINLITNYARNDFDAVRQIWILRVLTLFSVIGTVSFLGNLFITSFFFLFFVTAALDLLSDSHLGLRQIAARNSWELFFQPIKRLAQFLGLLLISVFNPVNSEDLLLYVLVIPSLALLIIDSKRFGGWKVGNFRSHYASSSGKWVQSGGSALVNLDNVILGLSNHFILIAILAITKKLFNAIAIIGTALFPRVLFDVSANGKFNVILLRKILGTISVACIPAFLFVCFLPTVFRVFWDQEIASNQLLMARVILIMLPVYLLSLAFNSVLLGLDLNRQASVGTYSSAVIYLATISVSYFPIDTYLVVSTAVILNAITWLAIEVFFLRRAINFKILEMIKVYWRKE